MNISMLITFAGGIGLFLLGMQLLTDGLKSAAGDGLRGVLMNAMRSRLRALASGILVTASVQSSSAVIFALIGFVNAGLLNLRQSLWVILGANVGTTATSWLVAVVGFKLDLQVLALPLIALGMVMKVGFGSRPAAALGVALAGLGLFFLGLDLLREGLGSLGDQVDFAGAAAWGMVAQVAMFAGAGFALTLLMQSSSAALVVVLTAAAGGVVTLPVAMAMVIGANVGTTSTAVFAALGATASAQRAAAAHVLFNVVVALFALVTFPLALYALQFLSAQGGGVHIAVLLALFHTWTKMLGLLAVWPLVDRFADLLERRFRRVDQAGPVQLVHVDALVLQSPQLALLALRRELDRLQQDIHAMARQGFAGSMDPARLVARNLQLAEEILLFTAAVGQVQRSRPSEQIAAALPGLIYAGQYLQDAAERFEQLIATRPLRLKDDHWAARVGHFDQQSWAAVERWNGGGNDFDPADARVLEDEYRSLKAGLMQAGARGDVEAGPLVVTLEWLSQYRRLLDQWRKLRERRDALELASKGQPAAEVSLSGEQAAIESETRGCDSVDSGSDHPREPRNYA